MKESVIYQEIEAQGEEKDMLKVAINLLKEGMSVDLIVRVINLTVEKVQQLQQNQQSNS